MCGKTRSRSVVEQVVQVWWTNSLSVVEHVEAGVAKVGDAASHMGRGRSATACSRAKALVEEVLTVERSRRS